MINNKKIIKPFSPERVHIIFLAAIILLTSLIKIYWSQEPIFLGKVGIRTVHTMVLSRELNRNGFDVFNTEVYHDGGKAKYVQAFPVYNLLLAGYYKLFGENERAGRYLSILFFAFAIYFLFRLLLYYIPAWWAIFAICIYIFSYPVMTFSFMIQETSLDLLLTVLNLYLFHKYLDDNTSGKKYAAWLVIAILNFMARVTLMVFIVPIIYLLYRRYKWKFLTDKRFIIGGLLIILLVCSWYFFAVTRTNPEFRETFISYFTDFFSYITSNLSGLIGMYGAVIKDLSIALMPAGMVLIVLGLVFGIRESRYRFLYFWFLASLLLYLFLPYKFVIHPYNHLPVLPVLAVFATIGLKGIFSMKVFSTDIMRWGAAIAGFMLIVQLAISGTILTSISVSRERGYIEYIGKRIENHTDEKSKIIFFVPGHHGLWAQEYCYASDRMGWTENLSQISQENINNYRGHNATHLAVVREPVMKYEKEVDMKMLSENYRLVDSVLDLYFLFELGRSNERQLVFDWQIRPEFDYGGLVKLRAMQLIHNDKSIVMKILWECQSDDIKSNLVFVCYSVDGKSGHFGRQIMNNAFPTARWRKGAFYSEMIDLNGFPGNESSAVAYIIALVDLRSKQVMIPHRDNLVQTIEIDSTKNINRMKIKEGTLSGMDIPNIERLKRLILAEADRIRGQLRARNHTDFKLLGY